MITLAGRFELQAVLLADDGQGDGYRGIAMQANTPERFDAIDELSHLFVLIQVAGRKLANDTHGSAYDLAGEINELLSLARAKLAQLEDEAFGSQARKADRRSTQLRRLTDADGRTIKAKNSE